MTPNGKLTDAAGGLKPAVAFPDLRGAQIALGRASCSAFRFVFSLLVTNSSRSIHLPVSSQTIVV